MGVNLNQRALPPRHSLRAKQLLTALAFLAEWCYANGSSAQNLTGQLNIHDPSSVVELDGRYYLFYTGQRVRSKFSDDLGTWTEGPRVFNSPPAWTSNSVPGNTGNFWAPDVAYFNNRYHVYYSVSTFGSQESAIGLVTNATLDPIDPAYEWTDQGPVIESNVGDSYNAIDPSILQTSSGEIWMTFGSFWSGIYTRRIDPSSGLPLSPPRGVSYGPHRLAFNTAIEAPYIHERDGYFYLFVNWGSCCQGTNSTYNIRVGRSTSVSGPYVDQNGVNMVNNGGTLFLATEDNFIGPGHISIFDAQGSQWFGYHYYDGERNGDSRYNLRAMQWTADGWPVAGPPFPIPEPRCLALFIALVPWLCAIRIRSSGGAMSAAIRNAVRPAAALAFLSLLAAPVSAQVSGSLGIHDPSTVLKDGSKYFLFGTGPGITTKQSSDHLAWSAGPSVFPPASPPSWTTAAVPGFTGNFWAPDVAYFNGNYHLYYSVSTFGSQDSAIGLVTNPTLDPAAANYLWTDQGAVIQSNPGANPYNAIDPAIIQTSTGTTWMTFGSFWNGIYITQLDPATGKRITPNSPTTSLARHLPLNPNAIEAPYIHERDGFFYLFVNWDTCCQGVNSTYNIRVGRSTSVTGPYLDQNGVSMVDGGGTLFLEAEDQYIGPGHIAIFEDQGAHWFGYHYYNGNAGGAPTYNLRTLLWSTDGWPIAGPASSPADLNLDGMVDLTDFGILSDHMKISGVTHAEGDMNGDGTVDHRDFHIWKSIYHAGAGALASSQSAVPEPTALLILAWGAFFWPIQFAPRSHRNKRAA